MNDTPDTAFEPMDKTATSPRHNADGTVTYDIVDGEVFLNDEVVKEAKVVGHVQIDEVH